MPHPPTSHPHPGWSRRHFLSGSIGGFFALAFAGAPSLLAQRSPIAKARRCLVLWMDGGPSQLETFDPKPETATGGPTRAIQTKIPGIRIAEHLPQIARRADQLAILRHITSLEGEHERARYFFHTGYPMVPGFPRPALGAVCAEQHSDMVLPKYVTLGAPGFGPAYLGETNGPFTLEDPETARRLLQRLEARKNRLTLTRQLSEAFDATQDASAGAQRLEALSRIEALIDTPFARTLDISRVHLRDRERYGEHRLGRHLLIARELLKLGVPFLEVVQEGWDTHIDHFNANAQLCRRLDQPWAALLDDLAADGLLDETLIIWMGEFGRTPSINGANGRDHFPRITPVVLAGAGIGDGRLLGSTNRNGTNIEGDSATAPDLFATIFTLLGIDPAKQFRTRFDSPARATDGGAIIKGLEV